MIPESQSLKKIAEACERAESAELEINEAHTYLSKYVNKEHWSLAGRIEGLVGMIIRARQDNQLDEVLERIQAEYVKQFETAEEVIKHV